MCLKDKAVWKGNCTLKLMEQVTPVINPPHRVPFALKDKLKSELDRLDGRQMIRKVKEPTDMAVRPRSGGKAKWKVEDLYRPSPLE